MRTSMNLMLLAPLALIAWTGCAPGSSADGGTTDAGELDAGEQPVVDAGHDAGDTTPPDGGATGECPTISPLSNPVGQPCNEEGVVCRESGCFAPGPSCLFIECRGGEWVNQALIDAGPRDAGSDPDAGESDDAGEISDDDAGSTDAA